MPTNARGVGCFLMVWVLGWTAGVLSADAFLAGALFHQFRALAFVPTEGTVTRSGIRTEPDGDGGDSHRLDIAYTYMVNGQQYTGTRYSHSEMGTNSSAWHAVRDGLPVGARVRVWYNPGAPPEAMLRPGLTGFHVSMIWFLTPFNVIMLGGWVLLAQSRHPAFAPTDPRSVTPTPSGVRVNLPTFGRVGRFALTLLGATFGGTFALGFGFGFNPPVPLGGGAYLAVVAVATWVAARHTNPFLEVNQLERVLRLVTGREPVEIPFEAIRDVRVTHEQSTDSEGDTTHEYHCELRRTDASEGASVRITTYNEPEPAEQLAAWLRAEVGLPDQFEAR